MKMKILLTTLSILGLLTLVGTVSATSGNDTNFDSDREIQDNGCPKHGFGSDADFCGDGNDFANDNDDDEKGIYACNVAKDTDKFCKENLEKNFQKENDKNKSTPGVAKITVGYGDVGGYYGKGNVVIKNLDTGETLVNKKLNFAKQHHNQGPDCCEKTYTFDKSDVHKGDLIGIKVTGGGGSWTDNTGYEYKKNLRISITLDEIGE